MIQTSENSRILIIDDSQAILEDFQKILGNQGHVLPQTDQFQLLKSMVLKKGARKPRGKKFFLDWASQGQEGYQRVKDAVMVGTPYALAFVDMRMPPGWDGMETILHLWEVDPDLQIVICSAYSDYDWVNILEKLGIRDNLIILKKPFDKEEILQLAHALTKKWELHRYTQQSLDFLEQSVAERTEFLRQSNRQLQLEIAKREQTEAELRLAQKMESFGTLATGLAHEINTPTQFVGDNIRFVKEGFEAIHTTYIQNGLIDHSQENRKGSRTDPNPSLPHSENENLAYFFKEIPKALEDSLIGIQRIAEIVQAMNNFSHPGTKEKVSADLNLLIENAITVSRNTWKHVADLKTHLSPNLPKVPCFPGELGQVMVNLIVNASHAIEGAEQKGLITIQSREIPDGVEVTIQDTGTGIPQEIQDKIYDPFFTTKEIGKGTGQGLSMVRTAIEDRLHGTLWFTTRPGQGTTFFFDIPVEKNSEDQTSGIREQSGCTTLAKG